MPAASQAQLMRQYATIDPNVAAAGRANPYGLAELGTKAAPVKNALRWAVMQSPFGDLANVFAASTDVADVVRDPATGAPVLLYDQKDTVVPTGGDVKAVRCSELLSHPGIRASAVAVYRHRYDVQRRDV